MATLILFFPFVAFSWKNNAAERRAGSVVALELKEDVADQSHLWNEWLSVDHIPTPSISWMEPRDFSSYKVARRHRDDSVLATSRFLQGKGMSEIETGTKCLSV